MTAQRPKNRKQQFLRGKGGRFIVLTLTLSLVIHLGFMIFLSVSSNRPTQRDTKQYVKVHFKEIPKTPKKTPQEEVPDPDKPIVETPLEKTEAPDEADYLGAQDHRTKKQTRIADEIPRPKAADPGQLGGRQERTDKIGGSPPKVSVKQTQPRPKKPAKQRSITEIFEKKLSYSELLAFSEESFAGEEAQKGYMDFIDDSIEDGNAIDLNTREYRYIGYFTGLRKAIELVWSYPSEAVRRGLGGNVKIKFIIREDGKVAKVSVLESSGYQVLDNAIVQAINEASPFSPLPTGFGKDQLVIKGNFVYTLQYSAQR